MTGKRSFFDLISTDLRGKDYSFDKWKGKKVLVVNTASECGLTPQFGSLEELYEQFRDSGFVIIGFPSNDFAKQEPLQNDKIEEFCSVHYGVTFPLMSKSQVKNGPGQNEIYQWLTQKSLNGVADVEVTWNFQKFAINEQGILVHTFSPETDPLDYRIIDWIKNPTLF